MVDIEPRTGIETFSRLNYAGDSPLSVVQQAYVVMNIPRSEEIPLQLIELGNNHLLSSTLTLVDAMEQGLYTEIVSRSVSRDTRERAERLRTGVFNSDYANEAFGLAKTTFAMMPRRLHINTGSYRVPFSLRGALRPPETLDEYIGKLGEIRRGVVDFVTNAYSDQVRYARAFLGIGATIDLKAPPTEAEERDLFVMEMGRMYDIPATDPSRIIEQ